MLKSTDANIVLLTSDTQSATSYATNSLTGTDTDITNPGNAYVLNNGESGLGFYKLSIDGTIKAHKAYLTYAGSYARGFIGFDETTGVNEVRSIMAEGRCEYFDLQGRRVSQPTKGLYIVRSAQGKKCNKVIIR